MLKLWLDDIRDPKLYLKQDGWVWVKTVEEAKEVLLTGAVGECSLDHDLGERVYVPSKEENTGAALVRWMVENDVWPAKKPQVHSWNPAGKVYMEGLIDKYWHPKGKKNEDK